MVIPTRFAGRCEWRIPAVAGVLPHRIVEPQRAERGELLGPFPVYGGSVVDNRRLVGGVFLGTDEDADRERGCTFGKTRVATSGRMPSGLRSMIQPSSQVRRRYLRIPLNAVPRR